MNVFTRIATKGCVSVCFTVNLVYADIALIPFEGLMIPIQLKATTVLVEGEVVLDQDKLLSLINTERTAGRFCGSTFYSATSSLSWATKVETAARIHSDDMYRNNFFSHTGSDASSTGDRLTRVGYTWRTWGENIAWGYTSEESVVTGWLNSEGHCQNIMNPAFSEMGLSRVGKYWTQVFARSQ